uniref:hypothetical protein n=1 Tax=Parerythrobacter lutipelagi TaxID=1964208 RepID=UPI001EFFAF29|nr:hypothetical protein [Parerythrobacter lutipelagi]
MADVEALARLGADFPDSGSVRLRLLTAQLAVADIEGAMASLEWLYDRGYVFNEESQARIPQMFRGVEAGRIAERLRARPEVVERSAIYAIVPKEAGLIESAVLAGADEALIVTSVTLNQIWFLSEEGSWRSIVPPGVDDLSGIAVDPVRKMVWAASSNIDGSDDDSEYFQGLLGLKLDVPDLVYVEAPEGVAVSDLHVANDGTVYASDPIGGGIYFARPEDQNLSTLVPPGIFRSPQGLATSADGLSLYVSDYRYGLALIDTRSGRVSRVGTDRPMLLDGIDALWRRGNELIAVQNGTSPMRISAFKLSSDGQSIIGKRLLEQAHSEWTEPLSGFLASDALYYVGNGQWGNYKDGALIAGAEPVSAQIRRLPLD